MGGLKQKKSRHCRVELPHKTRFRTNCPLVCLFCIPGGPTRTAFMVKDVFAQTHLFCALKFSFKIDIFGDGITSCFSRYHS